MRIMTVLAGLLVLTGSATAQGPVDVRQVQDGHLSLAIRNALYQFAGPLVGPGTPAWPTGRVVVVPVETPDAPRNPFVTPASIGARLVVAPVSVDRYFRQISWSQFALKVHGAPWAETTKALKDYTVVQNGKSWPYAVEGNSEFARTALAAAADVPWESFDLNNDKTISTSEAMIVFLVANWDGVAAGPTKEDPAGWASKRTVNVGSVGTPVGTFQFGQRDVVYISVREPTLSQAADWLPNSATLAHELLHGLFLLPDRYMGGDGSGWTGLYCIMSGSNGWRFLNPHDRMKLGWFRPRVLTPERGNRWFSFPTSTTTPAALILLDPQRPDEYWIMENRHRESSVNHLDADLPESGVAVWWVKHRNFPDQSDQLRLVQAGVVDMDPDGSGWSVNQDNQIVVNPTSAGYFNQGPGSLFNAEGTTRRLFYADGTASPFRFQVVGPPGPAMSVWIGTTDPPEVATARISDAPAGRIGTPVSEGIPPGGRLAPTRPGRPVPPDPTRLSPGPRFTLVAREVGRLALQDGTTLEVRPTSRGTSQWVRLSSRGGVVATYPDAAELFRGEDGLVMLTQEGVAPLQIGTVRMVRRVP